MYFVITHVATCQSSTYDGMGVVSLGGGHMDVATLTCCSDPQIIYSLI